MSTPGSSARGLQHNIYWGSYSHGIKQFPTLSSVAIDPTTKEETVTEMGTPYGVLTVQFYEKFTTQIEYVSTDDDTIPAMFMDTAPSTAQASVYAPHLTYQCPGTIYGNQTHMTSGKIFQAFVGAQVMGVLTKKQSGNDSEKVTIKGTGTQLYVVNAAGANGTGAIQYNRMVAGSPPYSTSVDVTFAGSAATLTQTAVAWPLPGTGGLTQNYLLVLKNGKPITSGFTVSGTSFTLGTAPAATDVWEAYYVYLP